MGGEREFRCRGGAGTASETEEDVSAEVSDLIYDWNKVYAASMKPAGRVLLNDESLRDGLQSPSVQDPTIEEKIEILHLMESLGINSLDVGLPGAGPRAVAHCEALAREIGGAGLKIKPNCAARSLGRARSVVTPKTGRTTFFSAPPKKR